MCHCTWTRTDWKMFWLYLNPEQRHMSQQGAKQGSSAPSASKPATCLTWGPMALRSALRGYGNKTDICHGCLKGFENTWAFKVQSFCFVCFWSTLESDIFYTSHTTLHDINAEGNLSGVQRAAFWKQPLGAGAWHVCLFGKQKDSEVTQTENWFSKYLKLKLNIFMINLLKYELKMKLSEPGAGTLGC